MYRMSETLSATDSSKPPALLMNNALDYVLYTHSPQMAILPVYHLPAVAWHGLVLVRASNRDVFVYGAFIGTVPFCHSKLQH